VQNWNLEVSRQITGNDVLDIGWVGSKATHLDTSFQQLQQSCAESAAVRSVRRPYPQYNRIRMIDSAATPFITRCKAV